MQLFYGHPVSVVRVAAKKTAVGLQRS